MRRDGSQSGRTLMNEAMDRADANAAANPGGGGGGGGAWNIPPVARLPPRTGTMPAPAFVFGGGSAVPGGGFNFGSGAAFEPTGYIHGTPGHYVPGSGGAAPEPRRQPRSAFVGLAAREVNMRNYPRAGAPEPLSRAEASSGAILNGAGPWARMQRNQPFLDRVTAVERLRKSNPTAARALNRDLTKRYAFPKGDEDWLLRTNTNWGPEQVEQHSAAVASLKSTLRNTDLTLLASVRGDILHTTHGVSANVELGTIRPRQTLEMAKSFVKQRGSIAELTVNMADDSVRLTEFEQFTAQLSVSREGLTWIRGQLAHGTSSKTGTHYYTAVQLDNISKFYQTQEVLALSNIRSLRASQLSGVGYDRIDRWLHNLALDIVRVEQAYENIMGQIGEEYPGYETMMEAIEQATANEYEAGVKVENFAHRIYEVASLIIATNDLHYTAAGNDYIKEKMFDLLAHLRVLVLHLEYKGSDEYACLHLLDLDESHKIVEDLTNRNATFRRTLYESSVMYASGTAGSIELLKMAGRSVKVATRTLANVGRFATGNGASVNEAWEGTKTLLKKASQPIVSSLVSFFKDYFQDEPDDAAALDEDDETDIDPEQLQAIVEKIRARAVEEYPRRTAQINGIAAGLDEGIAECGMIRGGLEEAAAIGDTRDETMDDIMERFQQDVLTKKANKKQLQALARAELTKADTELQAESAKNGGILQLTSENAISAEAATIMNNAAEEGGIIDLPMSGVNLSDRGAVRANAEASINYYRIFVEESLAEDWAESDWLVDQGYTRNYANEEWLENQGYPSNNEEWSEIRGMHPAPPRPRNRSTKAPYKEKNIEGLYNNRNMENSGNE